MVIDGNDSFWDGLLKLDVETTDCFGVKFVLTYAGFNLSTVTVSNRPLISKVKYLSIVEMMQKGPLYDRCSGVHCRPLHVNAKCSTQFNPQRGSELCTTIRGDVTVSWNAKNC